MLTLCSECGKDLSVSPGPCSRVDCSQGDAMDKRWCGGCRQLVSRELIHKCPESRCHHKPVGALVTEMGIKEYKCKKCGIKVPPQALDLTINTCSFIGCSLKDLKTLVDNLEDRKQGKSKPLPPIPMLLQNKVGNPEPTKVSSEEEPELVLEVDVPDPIVMFVDRSGKIEYKFGK